MASAASEEPSEKPGSSATHPTRIALFGVREAGLLGVAVYHQLVSASYSVTVFVPRNSESEHAGITASPEEYGLLNEVLFFGFDTVVSLLPMFDAKKQRRILSCAVGAGVKRFVMIEPGWSIPDPGDVPVPAEEWLLRRRITRWRMKPHLEQKRIEMGLVYTLIYTGICLDQGAQDTCLFDIPNKSAHIYAGGDTKLSLTTCAHIAEAITAAFGNPQETGNRTLRIQSLVITHKNLLQIAKTAYGADGWSVKASELRQLGGSFIIVGKRGSKAFDEDHLCTPEGMSRLSLYCNLKVGCEESWPSNDNELVGIKAEDEKTIKDVLLRYKRYIMGPAGWYSHKSGQNTFQEELQQL